MTQHSITTAQKRAGEADNYQLSHSPQIPVIALT